MNFHEFGKENKKTAVIIHGACMSWDMLGDAIKLLSENLHVIAVAVPGHDIEARSEFTSVEVISKRIEDKLIKNGINKIDLLYGFSMGGGIAIRILADNTLDIKSCVLDAGITPYELPWIITRMILVKDFLMIEWGKHSKTAVKWAFPPNRYSNAVVEGGYRTMRQMSAKTIWRVFDSTDNYSMPDKFPDIDTKIEYWCGEDEKKARKLDIEYVKKHIPNVRFRYFPNMEHGQYVMSHPDKFVEDIYAFIDEEHINR